MGLRFTTKKELEGVLILFLLILLAASCHTPRQNKISPVLAYPNGTLLERVRCPVLQNSAEFSSALRNYYERDILEAGLKEQLERMPLTTIFPWAENQRLVEATISGRCERIVYSSGGLRVTGFLLYPPTSGPHPVLIWLRGGNREFGQIEPVTLLNPFLLANAGFVVMAPQYRGADGGEGIDEFGGADVEDVLALIPLAKSLPEADVRQIFLVGASRGAMEGLIAIRKGLPVKAAAFRGGLYDLPTALKHRPEIAGLWSEIIPGFAAEPEKAMRERSAIQWAGDIRVPTLLLHGREDWRASITEAKAFSKALRLAGTPQRLVVFEKDEHQLVFHRQEWLEETVQWFSSAQ